MSANRHIEIEVIKGLEVVKGEGLYFLDFLVGNIPGVRISVSLTNEEFENLKTSIDNPRILTLDEIMKG